LKRTSRPSAAGNRTLFFWSEEAFANQIEERNRPRIGCIALWQHGRAILHEAFLIWRHSAVLRRSTRKHAEVCEGTMTEIGKGKAEAYCRFIRKVLETR